MVDMCADSMYRKSTSPQASTENTSLQLNRSKNKEALEKGLRCRRSVKELVNQGILLNPSISHPDKVRQLQRAKTSDILKQKIEKRPDRQYLINRRIIRDDKPGTSPYILEQCHNLEKFQLRNSLNQRLATRPGSLELIEKGVLQVDPRLETLIRDGSIEYPRVVADCQLTCNNDGLATLILTPPSLPSPTAVTSLSFAASTSGRTRQASSSAKTASRSMKDDMVVYRVGSLVFHNYHPKSSANSQSPSICPTQLFHQKQKAREMQQTEMLQLQETFRARRLVEQELSQRTTMPVIDELDGQGSMQQDSSIEVPSLTGDAYAQNSGESTSLKHSSSSFVDSPSSIFTSFSPNLRMPIQDDVRTSNTPVIIQTDNSGVMANYFTGSLDLLNVTQLRTECTERKLARSGTKASLIRQLEPYREEILAKHFPKQAHRSSAISACNRARGPNYGVDCTLPANQTQQQCNLQPAAPPPVWSTPILPKNPPLDRYRTESLSSLPATVSTIPSFDTAENSGKYFCPSGQVAIDLIQQHWGKLTESAPSSTTNKVHPSQSSTILLLDHHHQHQHQQLFAQQADAQGVTLRHSTSLPYFHNVFQHHQSSTIDKSPTAINYLQSSINNNMSSIVALDIPNGLLSGNQLLVPCNHSLTTSSISTSFPNDCSLSVLQNGPIASELNNASMTHDSHNTLLGEHGKMPLPSEPIHPTFSLDSIMDCQTSFTESNQIESLHSSGSVLPETVPVNNQSPVTAQLDPNSRSTIDSGDGNVSSHAPSLNQIEYLWMRIRQLRKSIAQFQINGMHGMDKVSSSSSESHIVLLQQQSEHERLSVLCRLLVIDRLDALDALLHAQNSPDAVNHSDNPRCDLITERNLMHSYLRRLGGTALVDSQQQTLQHRRSSSPFLMQNSFPFDDHANPRGLSLNELQQMPSNHQVEDSVRILEAVKSPSLTCSLPSPVNHVSTDSTSLGQPLSSSWSDCLQRLTTTPYASDLNDDSGIGRTMNSVCMDKSSQPLEPPPSPTPVDVFFDLWNSLLNDGDLKDEPGSIGIDMENSQPSASIGSVDSSTVAHMNADLDNQYRHKRQSSTVDSNLLMASSVSVDGLSDRPILKHIRHLSDVSQSVIDTPMINTDFPSTVTDNRLSMVTDGDFVSLRQHQSNQHSSKVPRFFLKPPSTVPDELSTDCINPVGQMDTQSFQLSFPSSSKFGCSNQQSSLERLPWFGSTDVTSTFNLNLTDSSLFSQLANQNEAQMQHKYGGEDDALFNSLDTTAFAELMDTTESTCVPHSVMLVNWPVDA